MTEDMRDRPSPEQGPVDRAAVEAAAREAAYRAPARDQVVVSTPMDAATFARVLTAITDEFPGTTVGNGSEGYVLNLGGNR